jgi:hypothetical protein
MDNAPTANSNRPVKSGGVYTALDGINNALNNKLNGEYWTVLATDAPSTLQTINTYNGRKLSDYKFLIFIIGNGSLNPRNSIILPTNVFTSGTTNVYLYAHGSGEIVEVDIYYNDDTSVKMRQDLNTGNPFTAYITIYGVD